MEVLLSSSDDEKIARAPNQSQEDGDFPDVSRFWHVASWPGGTSYIRLQGLQGVRIAHVQGQL